MRELCIVLTDEEDLKLAAKADKAGIINDLELVEQVVREWLNDDAMPNDNIAKALAKEIEK